MSLSRLVFPKLGWSELWEILNYLDLHDLWLLGCTCKSAFVMFLREKTYRSGLGMNTHFHSKFLSKYSTHDKILLVSYPRSGNSFLRKNIESHYGIVTGSDSRPNRVLSASLLKFGYVGEGITDQSVWVVKSHFPERLGYIKFPINRVILVVRNPFDSIESYFHMGMTNTHDKSLTIEEFNKLSYLWEEFMVHEAKIWMSFHKYWLEKSKLIPIQIVRYEDLLISEENEIEKITRFIQRGKCPEGWKRFPFLKSSKLESKSNNIGYTTRNRRIGKAFDKMNVIQMQQIISITQSYMQLFGYQVNTNTNFNPNDNEFNINKKASEYFELTLLPRDSFQPNEVVNNTIFQISAPTLSTPQPSNPYTHMIINETKSIRDDNDKFGRGITFLRHSLTEKDTKPFQTN